MAWIYTSGNFVVESAESPLVDRDDGGHVTITPLQRRTDILELKPHEAVELMRLMIITGQALTTVLTQHGIAIGRVNYQENGNWGVFTKEGPYQHMHIFGRALTARYQPFGQACYFPSRTGNPQFYEPFRPLTSTVVEEIRSEMINLLKLDRYQRQYWSLNDE
jgi:diadenosine tetraphosphate (Ap4A) HIT family hydrolase